MDDGDGLAVAAEQVSGVDVDELQDGRVELQLQRHGVEVAGVGEAMTATWKVLPTVWLELAGRR